MISPFLSSILLSSLLILYTSNTVESSSAISCAPPNQANGFPSQSNVNQFLSSIPSNASSNNGFFNETIGTGTGQLYGLAMCYFNSSSTDCQTCLTNASQQLTNTSQQSNFCVNSTDVSILNLEEESCMIHYANTDFFSVASISFATCSQDGNVSSSVDPNQAEVSVMNLMAGLESNASQSALRYATGQANYTNNNQILTIDGMVQCTRDLSADECNKCINSVLDVYMPTCTNYTTGATIMTGSCIIKFEIDLSN
ncbi:hypothetical protein LUZ60_005494 [Juncus effusus]|nr:hypothetical protein LUZ60_005494 [Juncus effusus]